MRRRDLLALCGGAAAALAGCTSSGSDPGTPADASPTPSVERTITHSPESTATSSPEPTPTVRRVEFGTPVTLDGGTLTLANPRIRKAAVQDNGIWQSVVCGDGQFLVVEAAAEGSVPGRFSDLDVHPVVDAEPVEGRPFQVVEGGPGEAPRDPPAWRDRVLAFPFPDETPGSAAVRWQSADGTAYWELDGRLRERLAVEPSFELRVFDVARAGEDVRVRLAVTNTGDRDGRFLGRVSYESIHDASSVVELDVPRGETVEYRDVPSVLEDVAADGRLVTMGFSGADGYSQVRTELREPRRTATAER